MEKYFLHYLTGHIHFNKALHDKYNDLLIADTFRQIALSMVALFVPIFLIKQGYSVLAIAVLELAIHLGNTVLFSYTTFRIYYWRVKRVLIISYVFNTLLYLALFNADYLELHITRYGYLAVVGLLSSIAVSMYWAAHHSYMISTTTTSNSGSKTGLLMAVPIFFGIIGPFLGGLIITEFNFQLVFLISSLLLVIASGSLFFSKDIKTQKARLRISHIIDKNNMSKNLTYVLQGVGYTAAGFMWPLLLFFSSIKLLSIGLLYLLSNIAHSIVCYVAGKESDRRGNRQLVQLGSIGHGITLAMRTLLTSIKAISFWQTLGGLFAAFHFVPLESGYYRSSHQDQANKTANRELYLNLGRMILIAFFILLLYYHAVPTALRIAIVVASLAIMGISLLANQKNSLIS